MDPNSSSSPSREPYRLSWGDRNRIERGVEQAVDALMPVRVEVEGPGGVKMRLVVQPSTRSQDNVNAMRERIHASAAD